MKKPIDVELIAKVVPNFTEIKSVEEIKGLTNYNWKVETNSGTIFYKQLNQIFTEFIDRNLERKIIEKVKEFPKIFHFDEKICIRNFENDLENLKIENCDDFFCGKFAEKLHEFHNLQIFCDENSKHGLSKILQSDSFFENLKLFVEKTKLENQKKSDFYKIIEFFREKRENLLKFYQKFSNFTVLCHNDLTLLNLLVGRQAKPHPNPGPNPSQQQQEAKDRAAAAAPFYLLDYEYAAPNVLFYDFANLFLEMEATYVDFPPFFVFQTKNGKIAEIEEKIVEKYLKMSDFGAKIALGDFLAVCEKFKVFSHFFWILVAIKSVELEIEFDFHLYVKARFEMFKLSLDKISPEF